MIDIDKIEAAAKAATPGPWIEAGPSYGEPKPRFFNCVVTEEDEDGDRLDICCSTSDNTDGDMTHIATANPAAVLEMVSMIRERDAVLKQALEAFEADRYEMVEDKDRNMVFVTDAAIAAIKEVLK